MKEKRYLCNYIENFYDWIGDHLRWVILLIILIVFIISAISFSIYGNIIFKSENYDMNVKDEYEQLKYGTTAFKIDLDKIPTSFEKYMQQYIEKKEMARKVNIVMLSFFTGIIFIILLFVFSFIISIISDKHQMHDIIRGKDYR